MEAKGLGLNLDWSRYAGLPAVVGTDALVVLNSLHKLISHGSLKSCHLMNLIYFPFSMELKFHHGITIVIKQHMA